MEITFTQIVINNIILSTHPFPFHINYKNVNLEIKNLYFSNLYGIHFFF